MSKESAENNTGKQKPPIIFFFILGSIPVIFFILIEIALRFLNYGYDYQLFKENKDGVNGMLYVNADVSYKYFGNLNSRVFNSNIGFYKSKPDHYFRIFVLGGSSTQGFPYSPQASFPAHLKRRLDILYPNKTFEVINMGASAINTYTIRDILPEILDQSPDLILIYSGHNEYYGALGAGSARSANPTIANLLLYLRDFRLFQLIENTIAGIRKPVSSDNKNLMQKMIGESVIEYGSETYHRGINQYQNNLSAILRMINKANVPVIISTMSSNIRDQKPLNSKQLSIENLSAEDYFAQGKKLLESESPETAKASFVMAKEYDGLRFRAPEKINEIIKAEASEYGIPLVDMETKFSKLSPNGITGANLMCDHLHPNLEGYFLMGKFFGDEIVKSSILGNQATLNMAMDDLDSLLIDKFPYTAFDSLVDNHILLSGLGQYPFVAPGEPNPYQSILDNDGVNFNSGSINEKDSVRTLIANEHLQANDSLAFIKEMQVFLSYFPYSEIRYLRAINLLSKSGSLEKGYPLLFNSLMELKESQARDRALGLYYKFFHEYDTAINYLNNIIRVNPEDELALLDIGFCYLAKENYSKAEEIFSLVIRSHPENQEAYHQRAVTRFELKNYEGTLNDIDRSIALKGSADTLSYIIRGFANIGLKDRAKACEDWQMSSSLGSKQAQILVNSYCNQ